MVCKDFHLQYLEIKTTWGQQALLVLSLDEESEDHQGEVNCPKPHKPFLCCFLFLKLPQSSMTLGCWDSCREGTSSPAGKGMRVILLLYQRRVERTWWSRRAEDTLPLKCTDLLTTLQLSELSAYASELRYWQLNKGLVSAPWGMGRGWRKVVWAEGGRAQICPSEEDFCNWKPQPFTKQIAHKSSERWTGLTDCSDRKPRPPVGG